MKTSWLHVAMLSAAGLGYAGSAHAQAAAPLPPPAPPPSSPPPPVVYTQPAPAPAPVAQPAPAPAPAPYQESVPDKNRNHERTAFNSLYVELLGNGGLYSLNYDRIVTDSVSLRAGFSYYSYSASIGTASATASVITLPLMVNYIGIGSPSHKLELGAGLLLIDVGGSASSGGFSGSSNGFGVAGTGVIGYRYVPWDGGFHFKVGFTPLFGSGTFVPLFGISFGATF